MRSVRAGGAAYLATHIQNLEATNRNSIVVSAGDLIGASPILSALFHDEPTIEAMNQIGLELNAVGNHEFDEGAAEVLRMANGGCHPVDGCARPASKASSSTTKPTPSMPSSPSCGGEASRPSSCSCTRAGRPRR